MHSLCLSYGTAWRRHSNQCGDKAFLQNHPNQRSVIKRIVEINEITDFPYGFQCVPFSVSAAAQNRKQLTKAIRNTASPHHITFYELIVIELSIFAEIGVIYTVCH